ncbi:protein NDRG2-like, partial [Cyanistes caeruleus]|uniref:protein NDRG2-like n=1 Tax=Cyanistes caeruleus TaxID=156563 RepID=UPI000CDA52FF
MGCGLMGKGVWPWWVGLTCCPHPLILLSRGDLGLERSGAGSLRCPVLLVVGDNSPHEDAVVECNAKLDPTQTSFLKMADGGGQPQIAQPGRLTEAIKYFLQGMGYMAASAMTRL